eukprot:6479919-Amphidinium_carterae.1
MSSWLPGCACLNVSCEEVVISPVNAIILRQYTCWPLVIVAGALWMGAEFHPYCLIIHPARLVAMR